MNKNELLEHVRKHRDAARMLVKYFDRIASQIDPEGEIKLAEDKPLATYDEIPPFGMMQRTKAHQDALDMGKSRFVPTYIGEDGQTLFKYVSNGYISIARELNIGLFAEECVLLTAEERSQVQQTDRNYKQWCKSQLAVTRLELFMRRADDE
jgi:hypothetical protein